MFNPQPARGVGRRQFSPGTDEEWGRAFADPNVQRAFRDPQVGPALAQMMPQGMAEGGVPDPMTTNKWQQLQDAMKSESEPTRYAGGGGAEDLSKYDLTELITLSRNLQPSDPEYGRVWQEIQNRRAQRGETGGDMGLSIPGVQQGQPLTGLSKLTGDPTVANTLAPAGLAGLLGLGVQGNVSPMGRIGGALLSAGMAGAFNYLIRRQARKHKQQVDLQRTQQQQADQSVANNQEPQKPATPPPSPPPAAPPPVTPDRLPQIPTYANTFPPSATTAAPGGGGPAAGGPAAGGPGGPAGPLSQYDASSQGPGLSPTQSGSGAWMGYEPRSGREIRSTDGTNWTYAGSNAPYTGSQVFDKTQLWGAPGSAPASNSSNNAAPSASAPTPAAPPPPSPPPASQFLSYKDAMASNKARRDASIAEGNYGFIPRKEDAVDRAMQKQYGIEEAATGTLPSQLLTPEASIPSTSPLSQYYDWSTAIPGAAEAAIDEGYYARGGAVHGDAAQDRAQTLAILREKKLIKKARGGFADKAAEEVPPPPSKKGKSILLRKPAGLPIPILHTTIVIAAKPAKKKTEKKARGGTIVIPPERLDTRARKPRAIPPKRGPQNGEQYAPYKRGGHVQVPRGSGAATRGKRFSGIY